METVEPGGLTAGNPTSENPDASEFVLRTPPVTADYRGLLGRAAFVAEHLWQMVSRDTWRESGAFAEGIYEGEVRADEVRQEIEGWKKLAGNASTTETAKPSNQEEEPTLRYLRDHNDIAYLYERAVELAARVEALLAERDALRRSWLILARFGR